MSGRQAQRLRLAACSWTLLAVLGATELREAAQAPPGSELLARVDQEWKGDEAQLLAALASPDRGTRLGAARLCAQRRPDPVKLLAALAATTDPQARRLAAAALLDRIEACPPAALASLGDPWLACQLLAAVPGDPLADAAVAKAVETWLDQALDCEAAAALVAAKGQAATWGAKLIARLRHRDAAVVTAAHQALELLTRTQRNLEVYAGDRDLLVQDWQDRLAELGRSAGEAPSPPPELAALVSDLPAPEALAGLLAKPDEALSAVEVAMQGADKGRRRELEPCARLLTRRVSPLLWEALGAEALADLDHEETGRRLKLLARVVAAIRARKDAAGLGHLLTWADDRDPRVRAAAFDWLTRLSDEKERLGGGWSLGGNAFPEKATAFRLRRSLRQGMPDEIVACLQFIGTLDADALKDDVAALLLAPDAMVVDSAMECLAVLGVETGDAPVLLRLAQDRRQPAARRAKALQLMAKSGGASRRGKGGTPDPLLTALGELAHEADPLVARNAVKTLAALSDEAGRVRLLRRLASEGNLATALSLAAEKPTNALLDLIVPALHEPDAGLVRQSARILIAPLASRYHASDGLSPEAVRKRLDLALRRQLHQQVAMRRPGWGILLALLVRLEGHLPAFDQTTILPLLTAADGEDRPVLLAALAQAASGRLDRTLALLDFHANRPALTEDELRELVGAGLRLGLLAEHLLPAANRAGSERLVAEDSDDDTQQGRKIRTLKLGAHLGTAVVEGTPAERPEADESGDGPDLGDADRRFVWRVVKPAPFAPDADGCARLATALARLPIAPDDSLSASGARALAVAILGGADPPPATASLWSECDQAWRILLQLRPELRPTLAAAINATEQPNQWDLEQYVEPGNPDLLPAVLRILATSEDDWRLGRWLTWIGGLPKSELGNGLARLAANQKLVQHKDFPRLAARIAPLPLDLAIALARVNRLGSVRIAPYGDEGRPLLTETLASVPADRVLAGVASWRSLREAGPGVFDRVLGELLARQDAASVAWLRSGIPLQAGLRQAYLDAEKARDPALALAGLALALKEERASLATLLAAVDQAPPAVQVDAAIIAGRYCVKELPQQSATVASAIGRMPIRAAAAWLGITSPHRELAAALIPKLRSQADADLLAAALAPRLRLDRDAWLPVVQALVAAAGGKLDYLLPMKDRQP